jgi:hypothetical protein
MLRCHRAVRGLQVLRDSHLPDCAQAYVQACKEAGLLLPSESTGQQQHAGHGTAAAAAPPQRQGSQERACRSRASGDGADGGADGGADDIFGQPRQRHQQQQQQQQHEQDAGLELFDLLGMRMRMMHRQMMQGSTGVDGRAAPGAPPEGPDLVAIIAANYQAYASMLVASL